MNTRKIGRELENYILSKAQEVDSKAKLTKNSGANLHKGDLDFLYFRVECKKKNTKNITVNQKVWDKLGKEIPVHTFKLPLYVLENSDKQRFAVLNLDDFFDLLKEINNGKV